MSEVKTDKLSPRTDSGTTTLGDSGDTFLVNTGAKLDINGTELILDADADTSITADTDDQIDFKVGGSDVMRIDANGIVTKPLQSSFRAYANGSTTFTDNTYIKVGMQAETYDTNADYNTVTSRFTAPVDGRYLFCVNIMGMDQFGTTDGALVIMILYVNNSANTVIHRMKLDSNDDMGQYYDTYGVNGSAIIKLDASDYVEIFISQNSGAGATMNYTAGYADWQGELLG